MDRISLSEVWQVLGPFQIGTREAAWGVDPLENFGGFRSLQYDAQEQYRSSLPVNGTVQWTHQRVKTYHRDANGAQASLSVGFMEVDWDFLRSIYGWAAVQYQAWARGTISIGGNSDQTVLLYTEHILEFWVDGKSYFGGDFYAYRRAPLVLCLSPGPHQLDVRLVYDVRAMGGLGEPIIHVDIEARVATGDLVAEKDRILVADVVDGVLASGLASIPLRNEGPQVITIWSITSLDDFSNVSMLDSAPFRLASGQSRPFPFNLSLHGSATSILFLGIDYTMGQDEELRSLPFFQHELKIRSILEPHKFTFLHPGGIVSYAVIRPPGNISCGQEQNNTLPVLLSLHGAGVEADSELVRHALDSAPDLCTWVLFPAGVTPWSGDDWHRWGFADVESAVAAISDWIRDVQWKGPRVDVDKWLVSGHSNGGQGTWYALAHRPDKIIAAAPVSGYLALSSKAFKLQYMLHQLTDLAYVPYQLWHEADPSLVSLVHTAMNNYRHELLADNFAGIPILQQHGGADDNVPAYHSRRMAHLIVEVGWHSEYVEIPEKGHWFDGVMTTIQLRNFYKRYLNDAPRLPKLPGNFSIVVADPGSMSSKGGIVIDQLESPDLYGRLDVRVDPDIPLVWNIRTSNVYRFHALTQAQSTDSQVLLVVDGRAESILSSSVESKGLWFTLESDGTWRIEGMFPEYSIDTNKFQELRKPDARSLNERTGRQCGALDAIMASNGTFMIVSHATETSSVALQISRNLFQYFFADSIILNAVDRISEDSGNAISIVVGPDVPSSLDGYPISIDRSQGVLIRDSSGRQRKYPIQDGLGLIYLRPLIGERLELIVWGSDDSGLRRAARLVPTLTGAGQADFILLGRESAWKGVGGVLAMGFLDHAWKVSRGSYFI
ncbi:MAG: hypothetical protein M1827_002073 [Pycnora praestabilis]|nr:MAG: hypothetical protein M1827_002073 [Pycnora praestabilis]